MTCALLSLIFHSHWDPVWEAPESGVGPADRNTSQWAPWKWHFEKLCLLCYSKCTHRWRTCSPTSAAGKKESSLLRLNTGMGRKVSPQLCCFTGGDEVLIELFLHFELEPLANCRATEQRGVKSWHTCVHPGRPITALRWLILSQSVKYYNYLQYDNTWHIQVCHFNSLLCTEWKASKRHILSPCHLSGTLYRQYTIVLKY